MTGRLLVPVAGLIWKRNEMTDSALVILSTIMTELPASLLELLCSNVYESMRLNQSGRVVGQNKKLKDAKSIHGTEGEEQSGDHFLWVHHCEPLPFTSLANIKILIIGT